MAGKVWRLLVGIKDGLVLFLMLLFFGGLYAALSASPHRGSAPDGALVLDLTGSIVEQTSEASAAALIAGDIAREHRARDLIHALDRAAEDDRIKAVVLDLDLLVGGGQTTVANVGDALDRVRRANKPVLAFATGYSDDSYALAAHASEIWLDPLGAVVVQGRGGSNLYYAGLLERLGITANVYRVGTYKSAVEPYTRNDMSPEAREASQGVANALWQEWIRDVTAARPRAQIAAYAGATSDRIAAANGDAAQAAQQAGLVDRIGDRTAFGRRVAEIVGAGRDKRAPGSFRAVTLAAWLDDNPPSQRRGRIGVVTVNGEITDMGDGGGSAGKVADNIERGLRDHNLAALVVRVDSPGGSVTGSEHIRRAMLAARERQIPVIVSFGSVAASGGYWIATAGDQIFAEPSTITGSIGVFGILPSFQGTLERIGIGADGVRTTPLSGEPDLLRGPSPEVNRLLQMGVENTYRRFIGIVSQARHLPPARVNEIGQGRVWDGGTARQLGLVDRFGSLQDAIAEAGRRANVDPAEVGVVWLEREPTFWERMLASMAGTDQARARDAYSRLAERPDALVARALGDAQSLLRGPAIQARCLECAAALPPVTLTRRESDSILARLLAFVGL